MGVINSPLVEGGVFSEEVNKKERSERASCRERV